MTIYLSDSEYCAANGNVCPNCRSPNVEATDSPEADASEVTQRVECADCDATWIDVYHLAGYTDLSVKG